MFGQAKYLKNSLTLTFPRQMNIRRKANEFEDKLKSKAEVHYGQPQVIPIPDDLDSEVPRLIFNSTHGYSQIIISQISLVLNVVYSPDWQIDISKGRQYLLDRITILFELLDLLDGVKPYFSGLGTRVNLPLIQKNDKLVLEHLSKLYFKDLDVLNIYDIQFKTAVMVSDKFFSNVTIQNYRAKKFDEPQQGMLRFPGKELVEAGVQIIGDFNDRYTFNEKENYYSTTEICMEVINQGFQKIEDVIKKVGDVPL